MAISPFPDPFDPRAMQARRLAQQVIHLLKDFIPRSSWRDAERSLYDAAYKAGARIVTDADPVSYSPPTKGATYGPGQTSQAAAGDPVGTPGPAGHGGAKAGGPNLIRPSRDDVKDIFTRLDPFAGTYAIDPGDRGVGVSASQLKLQQPWHNLPDPDTAARMQHMMRVVSSRIIDDQKAQIMRAMYSPTPPPPPPPLTVDMLLAMKALAKAQAQPEPKLTPLPAILKLPKAFMAGEVKGWRLWRVQRRVIIQKLAPYDPSTFDPLITVQPMRCKTQLRLGSLTAGTIWEPGEIMTGDPHKVSTGRWNVYEGVYALKDRERAMHELHLFHAGWGYDSALVLGEIAMWGRIVEHELGYRSSHAAVVALHYATDKACLPELRALYCPKPAVKEPPDPTSKMWGKYFGPEN